MRAGSHSPSSNWTTICIAWAAAHCLNSGSVVLPESHPIVPDDGLGGWDIQYANLVLPVPLVLAWDFWHKEDIDRFPRTKPIGVIVGGWIQLLEDVAWDYLRSLNNK